MKKALLLAITLFCFIHPAGAQTPVLWGIASNGGAHGNGSIIKIKGDGMGFDTVHFFTSAEGSFPGGHLLFNSSDNMLYGMTFYGGAHNAGTIFKINPLTGVLIKVHDMDTLGYSWTNADLVKVNDSSFYGAIFTGGADQFGQLFRFNPLNNAYSVVYHFSNAVEIRPRNIMAANDHKLYGTTDSAGANGSGTLFSFDPGTHTLTDLHDFDSCAATGTLVQAADGKIYGLTSGGGVGKWGTIYSYDPYLSAYTPLHDFDNTGYPGWVNGLTEGAPGILYGMTDQGTPAGIFRFETAGNIYTQMFNFTGASGNAPVSSPITGSDGNIYGMLTLGGTGAQGSLIRFNPADSTFSDMHDLNTATGYYPYGGLTEVPASVGFAEHTAAGIGLYPNPAGKRLIIKNKAGSVKEWAVYTVLGEKVTVPQQETTNNKQETILDVSSLAPGFYFVTLICDDGMQTGKFVKE